MNSTKELQSIVAQYNAYLKCLEIIGITFLKDYPNTKFKAIDIVQSLKLDLNDTKSMGKALRDSGYPNLEITLTDDPEHLWEYTYCDVSSEEVS